MNQEIENKLGDLIANHAGSLLSVFNQFGIKAPVTERNILVAYKMYGEEFEDALLDLMDDFENFGGGFLDSAIDLFNTGKEIKEGFDKKKKSDPDTDIEPEPEEEERKIWGLSLPIFWGLVGVSLLFVFYIILSIIKSK